MLNIKQALKLLSDSEEPSPLAALLSHATQQNTIQKELAPILPPSLAMCKISARIHNQELTLYVNSSAQASKLRQLLPTISQQLTEYHFTDIRIATKKSL